jgi:hypothetical protein
VTGVQTCALPICHRSVLRGISLVLFLPLEIVASVFLVAVAATFVAIALAIFVIRKQEGDVDVVKD